MDDNNKILLNKIKDVVDNYTENIIPLGTDITDDNVMEFSSKLFLIVKNVSDNNISEDDFECLIENLNDEKNETTKREWYIYIHKYQEIIDIIVDFRKNVISSNGGDK